MWHSVWTRFCFVCACCVYLSCLYPCMCSCCMPIIRRFVPRLTIYANGRRLSFVFFPFQIQLGSIFWSVSPSYIRWKRNKSYRRVDVGGAYKVVGQEGKRWAAASICSFLSVDNVCIYTSYTFFCSLCIGVPSFKTIWIRLVLMHLFSSACVHVCGCVCLCMSVLAHFSINIYYYMLATGIWFNGSLLLVCVVFFLPFTLSLSHHSRMTPARPVLLFTLNSNGTNSRCLCQRWTVTTSESECVMRWRLSSAC